MYSLKSYSGTQCYFSSYKFIQMHIMYVLLITFDFTFLHVVTNNNNEQKLVKLIDNNN